MTECTSCHRHAKMVANGCHKMFRPVRDGIMILAMMLPLFYPYGIEIKRMQLIKLYKQKIHA